MADQTKQLTAAFPTPPPYYQNFTKTNLKRLHTIQRESQSSLETSNEANTDPLTTQPQTSNLPAELRTLLPPPPPADQKYRVFNTTTDLNAAQPTLESSQIQQLHPSTPSALQNPAPHLLTLSRSLLTTFLALVGTLAQNPEQAETAVQDVQTLAYNVHDLINRYRPHQARESLVLVMEERVRGLREEIKGIREVGERVQGVLRGLGEKGGLEEGILGTREVGRGVSVGDGVAAGSERQRRAWEAMDGAVMEDAREIDGAGG
ncbi:hypothetical protein MBLNU230_g3651t1 [Neophaeotheca triangularis]